MICNRLKKTNFKIETRFRIKMYDFGAIVSNYICANKKDKYYYSRQDKTNRIDLHEIKFKRSL